MAEEEEKKEDQTEDQTEETNEEETNEEETNEENSAPSSMVQLEQRVTSLEERLLSVETPPAQPPTDDTSKDESGGEDESDGEDEESTEDVKKILGL